MKYLLTVSLLLALSISAQAQEHIHDDVPFAAIDISDAIFAKQIMPIPFSAIQVLTFCEDTTRLGFLETGKPSENISAIPDVAWTTFLQDFIHARFQKGLARRSGYAQAEMLWVIKDLRTNRRKTGAGEIGFVRLKADVYLTCNNKTYQLIASPDIVQEITDKNISEITLMYRAFWKLWENTLEASKDLTVNPTIHMADITANEQRRFTVPILQATTYKTGVYQTYQEFLENEPSVPAFTVSVKKKTATIYALNKKGHKAEMIEQPWGVCKDGELYRYNGQTLIPIEKYSNGFILSGYLHSGERKNKSLYWPMVEANKHPITTLTSLTQQPEATRINLDNGNLTF